MNSVIQTERLTKRYAGPEALVNLNLDIPEGAIFALIGPTGAGKTTAIKTILNFIPPTSGRAEVLGTDSRALGPKEFAHIGYVSENLQLPEWMKTGYFFSYCKQFYPSWHDQDLAAMIESYALPLDRPLKNLSRGTRMKASLAA